MQANITTAVLWIQSPKNVFFFFNWASWGACVHVSLHLGLFISPWPAQPVSRWTRRVCPTPTPPPHPAHATYKHTHAAQSHVVWLSEGGWGHRKALE